MGVVYRSVLIAALVLCLTSRVRAETSDNPPLHPSDYSDEGHLAGILWAHSLDVLQARGQVGLAASEVTRTHLYPNPDLEFSWGTIPIGQTNPPDLKHPMSHVPSYGVAFSELVELFKRGPRQEASEAELHAAQYEAQAVFADKFFDLLESIGEMAKNELEVSMLSGQIRVYDDLLGLERQRLSKGDIAEIDVDREEVERARLLAARDSAQAEMEQARARCSALVAAPCEPFGSGAAASAYLRDGAASELPSQWSAEIEQRRPDIEAMTAATDAAEKREVLAKRKVIPDVTVKLGYLYDTFQISGAQNQSLGVGLEMPIPVADRGQADLQEAEALHDRAHAARQMLVANGKLGLQSAQQQLALARDRLARLKTAEQKASELEKSVTGAARQGGVSQVDVLLARRAYQELLVESAEVNGEAFGDALKIRRAAAIFPQPSTEVARVGG